MSGSLRVSQLYVPSDMCVCMHISLFRIMDAGVEASFPDVFEFVVPASGLPSAEVCNRRDCMY